METIEGFRGNASLKRSEMAKIVSIYLTDLLEKEEVKQKQCTQFIDIDGITSDLHDYMIMACNL